MTRRSKELGVTTSHLQLAGAMLGLSGLVLVGPRRLRPAAGLALGVVIARGQAKAIATVNDEALAAAERGGTRHAETERRLDDLETVAHGPIEGVSPASVNAASVRARRRVAVRAHGPSILGRPSVDAGPTWFPSTTPESRL